MRVRRWTLLILLVSGLLFGRTLPCAGQEPSAGDEPAAAKAENPAPKAPEEKKSAAETGEKSLEEYLMLLRKLSSEGNFEKVLSLCDEAQKKFPDEETLNYFRTRAQRSIEERQAKGTRKFHSLRDMPTKAPPAETPSESASPAGQPAEPPPSEAENAAPEKTPAATPRAAAKTPAPAEPSVISSPTRAKSGNKWFPLIVGFALASGIVVVVAGILMIRRDKPRTAASMPSEESMMDYSAPPSEPPQSAPLFQPPPDQPWNTDPLGSFAKSTQASEDDLFSQEQSAAGSVAAPVRTSDMEEDSSFQSAELFSADEPASARPSPKAPAAPDNNEDLILFETDPGSAETQPKTAPPPPPRPKSEKPPIQLSDSAPAISFDTPSNPLPVGAGRPGNTPWENSGELDSVPMLKFDDLPPAAPKKPGESTAKPADKPITRAPWDSDSKTGTAGKKSPFEGISEEESLPSLSLDTGTAASKSPAPPAGFGTTGTAKKASPFDLPPLPKKEEEKKGAMFAEVSLRGIKNPEVAETITDLDQLKIDETLPGIELPPLASGPPLSVGADDELTLPSIPAGAAGGGLEETMVLSKKQLSEDPELLLPKAQGGMSKKDPAQSLAEKFQEFRADETIQLSFGESGGKKAAPAPSAEPSAAPAPPAAAGDAFEKERDLGLKAFKEAQWDEAVYHLSIAAALKPEATDVKEQLRRARRMRKEGAGGAA